MSLGISFLNRPRSASSASDSKPGRKNKNLQPVFEFTNYIEGLNGKYSGRSGTGDRKPYVPEFELRKYWTKSRVYEICKSHAPHLTIKFEVVSERCLRLFSVLVYLDRVVYFDPLLERGISDAKLPLADADVPQTLRAAPAFKDVLDGLLEYQWMFCPLVIDYAQLTNLQLQPSHILPFHDEEKIADGDAAHIYRILVDKHCNKLNEATDATEDPEDRVDRAYVLKTYTDSRYRSLYLNEAQALTTLRQPGSKNIVGYYGSFVQNGTFNLLLQFADGGNLLEYYANTPPPREPADVQRFWKSLFAVFQGLHAVHRITPSDGDADQYRGIHEDIKPDNIILTKNPSGSPYDFCPLLADFGHSHVRVANKEDGEEDSEMGVDRQGNQTYGAPECSRHARYLLNLPGRIPTAADIFSAGCVISDAASWVAFGAEGRDRYRKLRTEAGKAVASFEDPGHYDCFHDAVDRSMAVSDMHTSIRSDCNSRDDVITPRVLELVEDYMLLGDWRQRMEARQVWELFNKFPSILEVEEPEFGEPEQPTQTPSRRDRFKAKITRLTSTAPPAVQALPLPLSPFSDASVTSPGGGNFSSMSNNSDDGQLLRAASTDEQPPASPKLPPRPGLDITPNTNGSSRSLPSFMTLHGRSRSQRPTDSLPPAEPQMDSTTVSESATPLSPPPTSLFPPDHPSLPRIRMPVGDGTAITEVAGSLTPDKTHLTLQEALEWRAGWKAYGQVKSTTTASTATIAPDTKSTPASSNTAAPDDGNSVLRSTTPIPLSESPAKSMNLDPDTHQLIRSLHATLQGRDHIFVVDTSRTMRQHKADVERAFTALSYLVKQTDLNRGAGGVWLVLGSSSGVAGSTSAVYHGTKTSKLLAELEKCRYDKIECVMEDEFANFIQGEILPRLPLTLSPPLQREGVAASGSVSGGAASGGRGRKKVPNPLSIIVLTDGQWGTGPDGAGMQNPIRRLIETVKEQRLKRTQVMVQFLRFGDNADGIRHLRYLVNFGRTNECDIIDTQPVTGNVCEILIGSLSGGRDHRDGQPAD